LGAVLMLAVFVALLNSVDQAVTGQGLTEQAATVAKAADLAAAA